MKKIIELEKILEEQRDENLNHHFLVSYLTAIRFDLEGFVFSSLLLCLLYLIRYNKTSLFLFFYKKIF